MTSDASEVEEDEDDDDDDDGALADKSASSFSSASLKVARHRRQLRQVCLMEWQSSRSQVNFSGFRLGLGCLCVITTNPQHLYMLCARVRIREG